MSVQQASTSIGLECVKDMGTFRPYLLCDKGDLWQSYSGTPATTSMVVPNYTVASSQPTVSAYLKSSRVAGEQIADEIYFYIGAALIGKMTKVGNAYTKSLEAAWAGAFQLLDPTENPTGVYGLKLLKNLVNLTNGASGSISVKFCVSEGSAMTEFVDSIPFLLSEMTTNGDKVVIVSGSSNGFCINEKGQTIKLIAEYYNGTQKLTAGLTYKWYRQNPGANPGDPNLANWELLTETSGTLTVTADDINTSRLFMVVVERNGAYAGQDTQLVFDKSDVYDVEIVANPVNKKVKNPGDTIQLTSSVWIVSNTATASSAPLSLVNDVWSYTANTPAGTPIVLDKPSTTNQLTVTYNDIETKAGGNLIISVSVSFEIAS